MCDIVKCNSCRIVINELLAFIQNKADVMDEEGIVRLCATAFTVTEIEAAKTLLFQSIDKEKRKITRRKDKTERDLFDIIALFKETDVEKVPIFVARDLQKLPPVTFDHIDVTRLLKDLLMLQNEMKTIQDKYVTIQQFEEVKSELINLKQASIVNNFGGFVNTRRGANLMTSYACESGPMGLQSYNMSQCSDEHNIRNSTNNVSNREIMQSHILCHNPVTSSPATARNNQPTLSRTGVKDHAVPVLHSPVQSGFEMAAAPNNITASASISVSNVNKSPVIPPNLDNMRCRGKEKAETFGEMVKKDGVWRKEEPSEEWKLVQKRRVRNRLMGLKGKAMTEPEEKFRAADTKIPILIYNVSKDTAPSDISTYIHRKTNTEVILKQIQTKRQHSEYNSYKVLVPKHKIDIFMANDLWPEGISFRRFVDFKKGPLERSEKLNTIK